jgi:CBS domain-containing protein
MSWEVINYLSKMPHFSFLPRKDIEKIAKSAKLKVVSQEFCLAVQGETKIEHIYIVKKGQMSIYEEERGGHRNLKGQIKVDEVFGGISLLMNGGISIRTVIVDQNTEFYMVPKEIFFDLCEGSKQFYEYFVENFSKHVFDPAMKSLIESGQAKAFLSAIVPFSFLPEEAIENASKTLSIVYYPKGTILQVQGRSRLGHLYILQKGLAERYFEEEGKQTLRAMLDEGDIYGGISILLNDGVPIRTLHVLEDSYFYLFPKKEFQKLADQYEEFSEYFTDMFGKRMLDRTYASVIARASAPIQENQQYFNQPVRHVYDANPVIGSPEMTIQQAAQKMSKEKASYLIMPASGKVQAGIITTSDLAHKVIANGIDYQDPALKILTSPLISIQDNAIVFEALMKMMEYDIKHLPVTNRNDRLVGIISNRELVSSQGQSPLFLLREISKAESFNDIANKHKRMPALIKSLINSNVTARNINRMITTVSEAILKKVMAFALQEIGPPPQPFVFMILGSEGRNEQTLKTDQDNAIIFEDVPEKDLPEVKKYFLYLGEKVCNMLDQAGYKFCEGGIMAKNPDWCQPFSVWKNYFSQWIYKAEGEDLLRASIFFDFRKGYGEEKFINDLHEHLKSAIANWSGFLRHMTENALHFKPPLGFFRNFVVESKGKNRDSFDIKGAMMPIVDFARIYALKYQVEATNTFDRFQELYLKKALTKEEYEELEKAYGYLMQLRFSRQVISAAEQESGPDNFINPKRLTHVEQSMLKEIFKRIEKFQSKMNFEFIGIA